MSNRNSRSLLSEVFANETDTALRPHNNRRLLKKKKGRKRKLQERSIQLGFLTEHGTKFLGKKIKLPRRNVVVSFPIFLRDFSQAKRPFVS